VPCDVRPRLLDSVQDVPQRRRVYAAAQVPNRHAVATASCPSLRRRRRRRSTRRCGKRLDEYFVTNKLNSKNGLWIWLRYVLILASCVLGCSALLLRRARALVALRPRDQHRAGLCLRHGRPHAAARRQPLLCHQVARRLEGAHALARLSQRRLVAHLDLPAHSRPPPVHQRRGRRPRHRHGRARRAPHQGVAAVVQPLPAAARLRARALRPPGVEDAPAGHLHAPRRQDQRRHSHQRAVAEPARALLGRQGDLVRLPRARADGRLRRRAHAGLPDRSPTSSSPTGSRSRSRPTTSCTRSSGCAPTRTTRSTSTGPPRSSRRRRTTRT
jgi:hypothetical protein